MAPCCLLGDSIQSKVTATLTAVTGRDCTDLGGSVRKFSSPVNDGNEQPSLSLYLSISLALFLRYQNED